MKRSLGFIQTVLASSIFASSLSFAETTVTAQYDEPVPNPQLLGSATGAIEVTASGKINATGINGIDVDDANIVITVDPNNTTSGSYAIIASNGNAINIINGAGKNTGTVISIGAGSNITTTGTGSGIAIGDTAASIVNNGGLFGGASAIDISAGGTNAIIVNSGSTALIQGGTGPSIFVEGIVANGGTGLSLLNTANAVIKALNAQDAIQINQNFNSITNDSGSTIRADSGNAINIAPSALAAISGELINSGLITTTGTNQVIAIMNTFTGSITNNSGGVILAQGTGANAIFANSAFGTINNLAGGTIQATGTDFGINVTGNTSVGTINNAGTIATKAVSLLYNTNTNSTGFINTGTITTTSAANPTILGRAGAVVNSTVVNGIGYGIVNSGVISNTGGGSAIDVSAAGTNIPLLQQGGTITGNVLLSGAGGLALAITNGTIVGNVSTSTTNATTLQLNGGTITGTTTLGNVAGNIVNLVGTSAQAIIGGTNNDTFYLSGGSFTSLNGNGGVGAGDIINVTAPFNQNGTIFNVPTINVQNSAIYTVNNQITGTTKFNINTGGNMIVNFANLNASPNSAITIQPNASLTLNQGTTFSAMTATNNGTIALQPSSELDLSGNYAQSATGILAPAIATATSFGHLEVAGTATFDANSQLTPFLNTGGAFLPLGTQFDAVHAAGGGITAPKLVQPPSAIIFFDQTVTPNDIILTVDANPINSVVYDENAQSIGAALNPLLFNGTTNPELLAVLGQLELMPDSTYLTEALLQLVPSLNYALPASSRISMDTSLDSVQQRLEQLHRVSKLGSDEEYKNNRDYELYNGVNYGDRNIIYLGYNRFSAWAKVLGVIIDQHKLNEIDGFQADDVGLAVGGDWRLTNDALVGVSLSWNKVETTDNTTAENKIDTWSYQATFYGWFEPMDSVYLDTMLAFASHKYETLRNMQIGNFSANATAKYLGTHYGAQADLGYVILSPDNWYVAPYARFRYTYLDIGNYSETGAGGINLGIEHDAIEEMIGGLGIRIAGKYDYVQAIYVPEISATLLYDFAGSAEQMQGIFLGGGGIFNVTSNTPQQLIQLYSLGVNAYTNDGYCAALKLTFEHREQLFGYYGSLQISYLWD